MGPGARAGTEVAQLYLADPVTAGEPRQLKGFESVQLAPGQTKTLRFELNTRALSWWDPATQRWLASPGRYQVFVGTSSRDLPLHGSFTLRRSITSGTPTPPAPDGMPGPQTSVADRSLARRTSSRHSSVGAGSTVGVLP